MAFSSGNFGVLFVRSTEEPLGLIPVRENFRAANPDLFFEATSLEVASDLIRNNWCGVVCAILASKTDLIHLTKFLQTHFAAIKTHKTIRITIFSSLNHSQVTHFLQKAGVTEVLEFETPSRSISHKLSVHLKLVEKAKNQPRSTAIEFDTVFKGPAEKSAADFVYKEKAPETIPVSLPPETSAGLAALVAKTFQKQGASASWNGMPVEMVDQPAKNQITIDVPKADWKVGEIFTLDYETQNIGLKPFMQLQGKIQELYPSENGEREMIKVQLDSAATENLEKIQEKIEALQEDILQFMKSAKG
jgi:hypothetical protein